MSIPSIWFEEMQVRHTEVGPDGALSLKSFFDYMQLAAGNHADQLGVGIMRLHEHKMLWVLSRIKLKITRCPRVGDLVRIKTYPSGFQKLFATRQFELTMGDGLPVATASSFWLTLDSETFRPQNPAVKHGDHIPQNPEEPVFFHDVGKLKDLELLDPISFTARQSNMDVNQHLNNSFYPALAEDWLAAFHHHFVRITEIQVNFNSDLKLGGTVSFGGKAEHGQFAVSGHNPDGKNVFQSEGTFCLSSES